MITALKPFLKTSASNKYHVSILLWLVVVLSGCQPPASGNAVGFQYPILYAQLMNTDLLLPLNIPVQGVSRGQIVDTWGAARDAGRRHEGVDIFAKRGTAVLSSTSGIVSRIGENNLGGQVVWITGSKLSRHYYAHLDAFADNIQQGDWVEVGEVIGYVGNSGNAKNTPPHLHYGLYLQGQGPVNPYPYLMP